MGVSLLPALPRANHNLCLRCVCSHLWVLVWWNWSSPLTGSPKVPPQGLNWPTRWSPRARDLGAAALAWRKNPGSRLSQWVVWSCTRPTPHSTRRYLWMKQSLCGHPMCPCGLASSSPPPSCFDTTSRPVFLPFGERWDLTGGGGGRNLSGMTIGWSPWPFQTVSSA